RPLSLDDRRERGRDKYDYHSIDNQYHACDLTDLPTERKRLLSVDECCQECHHCDIHDAKWKEEHKQKPAASETIGSVNEPHTESTTISITPGTEDKLQRCPTFRKAYVLEWRQLIEASHHQQGTTNTGSISHEPHRLPAQSLSKEGERIGHEAEQRPDEQISTDEDPGRDKGLRVLPLASVDSRKHKDHRGC